jgi:protein-L-isoaspartate(D-aspartate) O-methyltransferase
MMRDMTDRRREMVNYLEGQGVIVSDRVKKAFLDVPRDAFVGGVTRSSSYRDTPLPIGAGQTISAPHMVAIMAEELELDSGLKVLEIGGGSGYHAAIVAHIIGNDGQVISIERIPDLVEKARLSLASVGIKNVLLIKADGSEGYRTEAPYDRIYYTCAAPYVPEVVMDQLKMGGILLSVEGRPYSSQRLIKYRKNPEGIEKQLLTHVIFVPLIGKHGQK